MSNLWDPVSNFLKAIWGDNSPRQLAFGFALGVMIGLLPKGNLTAATVTCVLLATRVNVGIGLLTAAGISYLAPWTDPWCHRIGYNILVTEAWQPTWSRWYQQPLVPWFALHNTVVLGALTMGITLFAPTYLLSRPVFAWGQQVYREWRARRAALRQAQIDAAEANKSVDESAMVADYGRKAA